jgi:hypothetical protein
MGLLPGLLLCAMLYHVTGVPYLCICLVCQILPVPSTFYVYTMLYYSLCTSETQTPGSATPVYKLSLPSPASACAVRNYPSYSLCSSGLHGHASSSTLLLDPVYLVLNFFCSVFSFLLEQEQHFSYLHSMPPCAF